MITIEDIKRHKAKKEEESLDTMLHGSAKDIGIAICFFALGMFVA